ncbi:MAG TPA: carboxypeptidase-like regulatory domain-containing protein [Planctomycetota bacterium]|nr:carboxypeptidase-like regulatory domain-containing protein [Planctomycetota bacterium]
MNDLLEDDELRIVDVLLEEAMAGAATPAKRPRRRWLAAVVVLLGSIVVAGVSLLSGGGAGERSVGSRVQDPDKTRATDAHPAPPAPAPNMVRLRVIDSHGEPVKAFTLGLRRSFTDRPLQFATVKEFPDRAITARDFDGDFVLIRNLPDGEHVLQITASQDARTRSAPFTVVGSAQLADLTVQLTRGGVLTGRVGDAAGKPIAGALVSSYLDTDLDPGSDSFALIRKLLPDVVTVTSARTDAAGRYQLPLLASGRYLLRVEHPDFCSSIVRHLLVADETPIEVPPIMLARGAIVEGKVVVAGQTGQVKVTISTPQQVATDVKPGYYFAFTLSTVVDDHGHFRFERRLPPGNYEISAYRSIPNNPLGEIAAAMRQTARPLTVEVGQDRIQQDFELPAK